MKGQQAEWMRILNNGTKVGLGIKNSGILGNLLGGCFLWSRGCKVRVPDQYQQSFEPTQHAALKRLQAWAEPFRFYLSPQRKLLHTQVWNQHCGTSYFEHRLP